MNTKDSKKIQKKLKNVRGVTLHEVWKQCQPTKNFDYKIIIVVSLILFFSAPFSSMLGFVFQSPEFLCYKENGDTWEYMPCTENEACSTYKDNFKLDKNKFFSIISDFNLICQKSYLKDISLNIILFLAPFASFWAIFQTDKFGRKSSFRYCVIFVIIGTFLSLIFKNIWVLTFGNAILYGFQNITFTTVFLYTNEIMVDPIRSQAPGIQAMIFSVGQISNNLIKAFSLCFLWINSYKQIYYIQIFSGIIIFICSFFLIETPYYYINSKQYLKLINFFTNILKINCGNNKVNNKILIIERSYF